MPAPSPTARSRLRALFDRLLGSTPLALSVGRRGERVAARALRRAGYRILAHNVRTPLGEVDLLALDGEALVIVEVKTGRRGVGSRALEARLRARQRRRLRGAASWLARRPGLAGRTLRRDLVCVELGGRRPQVTVLRARF